MTVDRATRERVRAYRDRVERQQARDLAAFTAPRQRQGPCEDCAVRVDVIDCPVCGAAAYLVHPGEKGGFPLGPHHHVCQACRRAEADAEADSEGIA